MADANPTVDLPRIRKPRLHGLIPNAVAEEVARATFSRVLTLADELSPYPVFRHCPAFKAEETSVYQRVRELATYAIHGGTIERTGEHLVYCCLPLFGSVLGSPVQNLEALVESEPDTPFGVVVLAALARDVLADRGSLTATELSVLAALDRDRVIAVAGKGEIPGATQFAGVRGREWRFPDSDLLRQWLTLRGLRWSDCA